MPKLAAEDTAKRIASEGSFLTDGNATVYDLNTLKLWGLGDFGCQILRPEWWLSRKIRCACNREMRVGA